MRTSLARIGRNRPDYARGATIYCTRHLIERAQRYYDDEATKKYNKLMGRIQNIHKLRLDTFGDEAMRTRRRRRYFVSRRPSAPKAERVVRGSLQRLAVERKAFARLTWSIWPPNLFGGLMRREKLLSHRLVRMAMSLQDLGFDEGWEVLREQLEAAMAHAVSEIKTCQRQHGLGAEAYAIKSIAQRRKTRETRSNNPSSSDVGDNVDTRGKLVCAACPAETQEQQSDRPWASRWWIAMLRGLYRNRTDTGMVERALLNDTEARLCVVYGIVMVVIFRDGEEPHFFVLDMEPFDIVSRSKPKPMRVTRFREKTEGQTRASWKRKRQGSDGNENEPSKRRRGSSSPLRLG